MSMHGLRSAGPAGDNPHFIGRGMEKRTETLCHQFLLKSHLETFVIHPHNYYVIYLLMITIYLFIYLYIYIYIFFFLSSYILYIFFINCTLVYINFLWFLCLFAFVSDLFTTTNIILCIYLNNNIFICFYTWTCLLYKINFKKLKTNGFVMNG